MLRMTSMTASFATEDNFLTIALTSLFSDFRVVFSALSFTLVALGVLFGSNIGGGARLEASSRIFFSFHLCSFLFSSSLLQVI